MGKPLSVLLIEDSIPDAKLVIRELQRGGYDLVTERVETETDMKHALCEKNWDIILSDYTMPCFNAPTALSVLQDSGLDIPFIIVSGTVGEETAVECLKAGANDFLIKGHLVRLLPAIQRELRESAERRARRTSEIEFQALFDTALDCILIVDDTGRYLNANPAACQLFGITKQELLEKNISDLFFPEEPERFREQWQDFLETGEQTGEIEIRQTPQGRRVLEFNAVANFLPHHHLAILRDITERKNNEEALLKAKEAAEEANHRKSQFLSNMSHEFRTPLNSIIGFSEMLESGLAGGLTEKQTRYLQNIILSGQHLLDLVNNMLDVNKIEAGKMDVHIEFIDFELLVVDIFNLMQDQAKKRDVHLNIEIHPDLRGAYSDQKILRQIFLNLLSNGIKFNHQHGTVNVQLYPSSDKTQWVCEIRDSGIGIPEEKVGELFTEFYQVDSSFSRQHEGSGLGLALTRRLIELLGGSISVESALGKGTTFTFKLPFAPSGTLNETRS